MQLGLNSCGSLGQTSLSVGSQQIPKHSFFSRNTYKKLVSSSHGCIFEAPKTISVHTQVCYSCQNCSSNQGTEMLLLFVVHLPKCSRIPQRKFRIVGTHYDSEDIQKMHAKNSSVTLKILCCSQSGDQKKKKAYIKRIPKHLELLLAKKPTVFWIRSG